MSIHTECVGFQKYEVYADPEHLEHVGTIHGDRFHAEPLASILTSQELWELAEFMEANETYQLH